MIATPIAASRPARIGEVAAGMTTLEMIPSTSIAPEPAPTRVAPITPPIKAWDEEDGIPNHQVARFQLIAPISPRRMMIAVTAADSTIPSAIVAATESEMKAPTKLRTAAIETATLGGSAPVAIVVAIALAVSWKALVQSELAAAATGDT